MSADCAKIYGGLHDNLLKISEQLSKPCIEFSERWQLMSVDKLKEIQDHLVKEHVNQEPKIMRNQKKCFIFGETSAGKSTLINAILNRKHLQTRKKRTTNCFVEIKKSDNNKEYFKADGKEYGINSLKNKVSYTHEDHLPNGSHVEVFYSSQDCPILENNTVIIDTPGIDTDEEMDGYITKSEDADLIVLVVDSKKAINKTMKEFIKKSSNIFSKLKFFLVYNFWDKVDEDSDDSEDSDDDKEERESDNNRNDIIALKNQLMENANALLKECLTHPTKLENECIFFISAKEQMRFNRNKTPKKDERWKYRHDEFERFLDKLKKVLHINENKRKCEYLEELCDVQRKVLEECKSVIGKLEKQMQSIALKYFLELKYIEPTIDAEIKKISQQSYERHITLLLKENNKNEEDIIKESIEAIFKQSMDELTEKISTEIKNKNDEIIKKSINSILQSSYDTFAADLNTEINKERDVGVRELIKSILKTNFNKIRQDLFGKMSEKDDNSIEDLKKSLSKQCYDNLIKDSVKEMNEKYAGSIEKEIKTLLEQSFKRLKKDLTNRIYEMGKELLKDVLKSLLEKSSDQFIEFLYDNINNNNDEKMISTIGKLSKLSYNEFTRKIFIESNMQTSEMVKTTYRSKMLSLSNFLNKYLLKDFSSQEEGIVEGLLKDSLDKFNQEVSQAITENMGDNSPEISQNPSYDNLIKNLYKIKSNKYGSTNKVFEQLFNQSFNTFFKEFFQLNNDKAIKESIESILKQFFDKMTQDLLREINPDEFDRIKDSNQATSDPFYTNLTQDLLTRMNKKVNEVFKIQIKVNSDPSYDCLLRDLFVVSNKVSKITKEINESTKTQFFDKLVEDLSNKIITSESEVIKECKDTSFNKFWDLLRQDLFREIDINNNFLIAECIEPVLKSFYDGIYEDVLNKICVKTKDVKDSSAPSLSQQSYTLIVNKSFEWVDSKSDLIAKDLMRLAEQSYKTLTDQLCGEINNNNDVKINKLIKSKSQLSRNNFMKELSEVFKDRKCKDRITDPLESVSNTFLDQLIIDLLEEMDRIRIERVEDKIISRRNESFLKLTKDLHREISDKSDTSIKSSIESVMKESQTNLIKNVCEVFDISVGDLMRQKSMREVMKTIFSDYLTEIKERVKSVIQESDNTSQMFLIENLYFPYYLEPHFPHIDSSAIPNLSTSGNRNLGIVSGLAGTAVTIGAATIHVPLAVVVGVGGFIVSVLCASGVLNAAEKLHNFSKMTKRIIEILWKNDEKKIKENWKNMVDFISRSNSNFLAEIKYKLMELFESERKKKDLKERSDTLGSIKNKLQESKDALTTPSIDL